ncbi:MAG: hypothetical protein U5R46_13695 [Gammaproteobacteria bacterium]|nr:hypothetical protein [Gammaproteobacteria bacterium]
MKHIKALAIVPALAVALTGLLTTSVASAEWYKHFDSPAYTTKDRDSSSSQEQFAHSGTVTTDARNMDQDKRGRYWQTEHEITNNLR